MDQTIYAPSSGSQKAGVSVIRVSGPATADVVSSIAGGNVGPRVAHLRALKHPVSGEVLDRGLVLWFPHPLSFTGEDVVEFHVHGGRAVVQSVIEAIGCVEGCRLAEAGEFSKRAFWNGKLDLSQVEALSDLINAETEAQRRQALIGTGSELVELYGSWRAELIGCLAYVEAKIDFVEEDDVPDDLILGTSDRLRCLVQGIEGHLQDPQRGEILRDGYRVVIGGAPNVGKSSLLNCLARRDVAIVSDIAGTTRDVNEVFMDIGGFPVLIMDTAGLRDTDDVIEKMGVERSENTLKAADLIVWIRDHLRDWPMASGQSFDSDTLWVRNKSDLLESDSDRLHGVLDISTVSEVGISALLKSIEEMVTERFAGDANVTVLRLRHLECLRNVLVHLQTAISMLDRRNFEEELVGEEVRQAVRSLGRIAGRVDVEDLLDVVFGEFCVGK